MSFTTLSLAQRGGKLSLHFHLRLKNSHFLTPDFILSNRMLQPSGSLLRWGWGALLFSQSPFLQPPGHPIETLCLSVTVPVEPSHL